MLLFKLIINKKKKIVVLKSKSISFNECIHINYFFKATFFFLHQYYYLFFLNIINENKIIFRTLFNNYKKIVFINLIKINLINFIFI